MLELGSQRFQSQGLDIFDKGHAVGVAHGHAGDLIRHPVNRQRLIDHLARCGERNLAAVENRLAHIDRHPRDAAVFELQKEDLEARVGIHFQGIGASQAVVVDVFAHTPDPVAAHRSPAAVGVIHLHAGVGGGRGADQDQAVTTNAGPPFAQPPGQAGRIGHCGREGVDVHVIVADAVHFGERQFHRRLPSWPYHTDRRARACYDPACQTCWTMFEGIL